MIIEVHMLQNVAPSNLNRDDMNAPKEATFGGYRRGRISSQCIKRAIRTHFNKEMIAEENRSTRTLTMLKMLINGLGAMGHHAEDADKVARAVLKAADISVDEKRPLTGQLLFFGRKEVSDLISVCNHHWDYLFKQVPDAEDDAEKKNGKGRAKKDDSKIDLPDDIKAIFERFFVARTAVDLALFGRMIANKPKGTVDAACQMAHAITTNAANPEFDFFTAVDDEKELAQEESGSAHMGTIMFNSGTFYRYASLDTNQLAKNLEDQNLAPKAVEAFLRSSFEALPSGKQTTLNANNPPSLFFVVVRKKGVCSLTNAFAKPIKPTIVTSLVEESVKALDQYWGKITKMFGTRNLELRALATTEEHCLEHLKDACVDNVDEVVTKVMQHVYQVETALAEYVAK